MKVSIQNLRFYLYKIFLYPSAIYFYALCQKWRIVDLCNILYFLTLINNCLFYYLSHLLPSYSCIQCYSLFSYLTLNTFCIPFYKTFSPFMYPQNFCCPFLLLGMNVIFVFVFLKIPFVSRMLCLLYYQHPSVKSHLYHLKLSWCRALRRLHDFLPIGAKRIQAIAFGVGLAAGVAVRLSIFCVDCNRRVSYTSITCLDIRTKAA